MFTDVVKVKIAAGKGGDGVVSFHRTRGNAKGGPDGGDGGTGGNVVVIADHNTNTLSKYRASKLWQAEDGTPGSSGKKRGRKGEDIELVVPPGMKLLLPTVVVLALEMLTLLVQLGRLLKWPNLVNRAKKKKLPLN